MSELGKCPACTAPILWARMPTGSSSPLDPQEIPLETVLANHRGVVAYYAPSRRGLSISTGNLHLMRFYAEKGATFHMNHFATCPERKRFTRSKAAHAAWL